MEPNLTEPVSKPTNFAPIIVGSVLIAALITGGSVYAYEKSQNNTLQTNLQNQIDNLKKQISTTNTPQATPTPLSTIQPTNSPTTPPGANLDPTANWKTYNSNVYGLTIKYPSDWVTLDYTTHNKSSIVSLASPTTAAYLAKKNGSEGGPEIRANYFSSAKELTNTQNQADNSTSLLSYLKTEKAKPQDSSNVQGYSAVKIGQYDGYNVQQPNIGGIAFYYIEHNGHVYSFILDAGVTDTVTQILSTLQFN